MDIKLFLLSVFFVVIGVVIMVRHKFYKYDSSDMLFATKLKVFLSGLLFCFIGCWGLISEISKLFK